MKAKKYIEKKTQGEYEIIKNHVIECNINTDNLEEIADLMHLFDDDADEAYFKGVCFGFDYEIAFIDVDKFIKAINHFDFDEEDNKELIEDTLTQLEEYKGYTLYL